MTTAGSMPGDGPVSGAERPDPVQAQLAAIVRWQAAESRLYPLIMSDPELYESAVGLVVEAREVLRAECSSVFALVDSDPATVLARCPSAPAVRDLGFDPLTAFDAARAQRFRELPESGGVATDRGATA